MHDHVADRVYRLALEDRCEPDAVIGCLPDATRGRGQVVDPRVHLDDGDVHEAATHVGRPNRAETQRVELGRPDDLADSGKRDHRREGEYDE